MFWPRLYLSPDAPPADPPPDPPEDPAAPPDPASPPPAVPPAGPPATPLLVKLPDGSEVDVVKLQAELAAAQRNVRSANAQAADRRTAAAKVPVLEAQLAAVMKALNIENPPEDPAALTQAVADYKSKFSGKSLELAIYKSAAKHGAKADMTARYLRGGSELSTLDPDADDYEAQVEALVVTALAEEPALKLAAAPPRQGGAPFSGQQSQTLRERIAAAEKAGDVPEAIRLKLALAAEGSS